MFYKTLVFLCFVWVASCDDEYSTDTSNVTYFPNWESLDSRPLPSWYDEAKFGIFIHWGVFSVPSFGSEWFWKNWAGNNSNYVSFMNKNYAPNFTYQDFARDFTAEFFDPVKWTKIFESSGAKYVVLTSKHHEGYALWPSMFSFSWNSMDVGPHKDLVGELATAIKESGKMKFGVYHSLYEWFHPFYVQDKKSSFTSDFFVRYKLFPQLIELVNKYEPEVIWSDGDWEAKDTYWKSKEFLSWLYNKSPVSDTVVVNDRWGSGIPCKHGGFFTCTDRFNPGVLQEHKWENCMTIDKKSWGFRRNAMLEDYLSVEELVKELVVTVSCGGNLLMNVGPAKDGTIPVIFEDRLASIGKWLNVNGEAIFETQPWRVQNDSLSGDVWYTKGKHLYATFFSWAESLNLGSLTDLTPNSTISLLGFDSTLDWSETGRGIRIQIPPSAHRGQPAWVIKVIH